MAADRRGTEGKRLVWFLLALLLSAYAYFGLEAKAEIKALDTKKVDVATFNLLVSSVNRIDKNLDEHRKMVEGVPKPEYIRTK